jgi:hypothetical protein
MRSRLIGTVAGALLGALIGGGTGIVGGVFGGVAGASIFTLIGAVWGFSALPDAVTTVRRWQTKRETLNDMEK